VREEDHTTQRKTLVARERTALELTNSVHI